MTPEHWDNYVFSLIDLSPGAARRRFRQSIKDEWGCCAYCGRSSGERGEPLTMTLDHVRPRAFGGADLRSNLVPACRRCNTAKGSERDWYSWYVQQSFFCPERAARIKAWLKPERSPLSDFTNPLREDIDVGRSADDRAGVPAQARSSGSAEAGPRGAHRRIVRFLGGAVSAQADLSVDEPGRWLHLHAAGEASLAAA